MVLPAKVKMMNFSAAYFLRGPPHTPMKKNIGIRTISQKM